MIVSPTEFLRAKLEPISKQIDGFGGFNMLCGLIAAGGEPHVFITGNLDSQPTLAKEIYTEMGKKLLELAEKDKPQTTLIV